MGPLNAMLLRTCLIAQTVADVCVTAVQEGFSCRALPGRSVFHDGGVRQAGLVYLRHQRPSCSFLRPLRCSQGLARY